MKSTCTTSILSSSGVEVLVGAASLLVPSSPFLASKSRSTTSFEFSSPLPPFQHGESYDGDIAKNVQYHQQQNRNAADPRQHDGNNQHHICDNTDELPTAMQKSTFTFERFSLPLSHSPHGYTALYGRPRKPSAYDCSQESSQHQQSSNKHQTPTIYGSNNHNTSCTVPFSPIILSRKISTIDSTTAVTLPTSLPALDSNDQTTSILSNDDDCNIIVQHDLFSNHGDKRIISSPSTTTCSTSTNSGSNDYEHVLKRRKIGRQEYQFDKKRPGDDDDDDCDYSIETFFETVSTATSRSTQSLNISDIKTSLCDDLDAFPLFPESLFGQQEEKKARPASSSTRQRVPTIGSNIYSHKAWSDVINEMTSTRSQGVQEEGSTTPANTASTNDEYGFRNLLALSDRQLTTSFTIEVFNELEFVLFEESDRRNQRTHLISGFTGLACRHCKVTSPGRRGGRYFPSTMKTLTDSNKTLFAIHKHLVKCKCCPDDVKTNLNHQHASEKKNLAAKRGTGQRPFFNKVWGILRSKDDI